jgi:hypothetical protein
MSALILQKLESFQKHITHQSAQLDGQAKQIAYLNKVLSEINAIRAQEGKRALQLSDIAGKRDSQFYTVEIDFDKDATNEAQESVEVNTDGPFICSQIQATWQCTDAENEAVLNGRHMPISAYGMFLRNAGAIVPATLETNLAKIPEFNLKVLLQGSGRSWMNKDIPGHAFYGEDVPLYLPLETWIDPNNRLEVHAYPQRAVPHTGKVILTFTGYTILDSNLRYDSLINRG